MSQSTFPVFFDQGGAILHSFMIDGSAVGSSASTSGLDGRGAQLATISDAGGATQTILFNQSMINAYVHVQPLTANGAATLAQTTNSAGRVTGFTLAGVERDDNTSTLADQDWNVFVIEFTTTQYVQ